jgi:hypothetical protein
MDDVQQSLELFVLKTCKLLSTLQGILSTFRLVDFFVLKNNLHIKIFFRMLCDENPTPYVVAPPSELYTESKN